MTKQQFNNLIYRLTHRDEILKKAAKRRLERGAKPRKTANNGDAERLYANTAELVQKAWEYVKSRQKANAPVTANERRIVKNARARAIYQREQARRSEQQKVQKALERAQRQAQREARAQAKAQRQAQRQAQREARAQAKAQREAERAQRQAQREARAQAKAQREAERAQRQARAQAKAQREAERAQRQAQRQAQREARATQKAAEQAQSSAANALVAKWFSAARAAFSGNVGGFNNYAVWLAGREFRAALRRGGRAELALELTEWKRETKAGGAKLVIKLIELTARANAESYTANSNLTKGA